MTFKRLAGCTGLAFCVLWAAWTFRPSRFAVNFPRGGAEKARKPASELLARLTVAPGFTVSRFATGLPNARFMRVTETGDILITQPRESKVTVVFKDASGDGISDGSKVLLEGLDRPHGLALWHDPSGPMWLYVAEMTSVSRIEFDAASRQTKGPLQRVVSGLPSGGNHWTRTIGIGPDQKLYVAVGSSCNVCIEKDDRRAAITRYDLDGRNEKRFATGLRNAVGFAWRPETAELFATDNGRDLLGDTFPPCELNRVVEGGFYGWPFANGANVPDPDYGDSTHAPQIANAIAPVHEFPAHNAPLGIAFVKGDGSDLLQRTYRGAALVALHGSWNRTAKDGYKVVSLHWNERGQIEQRDFLSGFLGVDEKGNEDVSGRPVDVVQDQSGAIYVSDDFTGSILRVVPRGASNAVAADTQESTQTPVTSSDFDATLVAAGRKVFLENKCGACHDPDAVKEPGKTAKPLASLTAKYSATSLVRYLEAPQPPMPLFDLSQREKEALAAYLLTTYR